MHEVRLWAVALFPSRRVGVTVVVLAAEVTSSEIPTLVTAVKGLPQIVSNRNQRHGSQPLELKGTHGKSYRTLIEPSLEVSGMASAHIVSQRDGPNSRGRFRIAPDSSRCSERPIAEPSSHREAGALRPAGPCASAVQEFLTPAACDLVPSQHWR